MSVDYQPASEIFGAYAQIPTVQAYPPTIHPKSIPETFLDNAVCPSGFRRVWHSPDNPVSNHSHPTSVDTLHHRK
jgi:hypothetical protein